MPRSHRETCFFVYIQFVLSLLAPVAGMSKKETSAPRYNKLKDSYLKLQHLLKKETFLRSCKEKVIPNGLNLHFNLAHRPTDNHLQVSIQSILNTASSRILDVIHEDVCKLVDSASYNFSDIREETNRKNGMHLTDYYVGQIRKECKKELEDLSRKHEKKLSKLTPFTAAISNQSI